LHGNNVTVFVFYWTIFCNFIIKLHLHIPLHTYMRKILLNSKLIRYSPNEEMDANEEIPRFSKWRRRYIF